MPLGCISHWGMQMICFWLLVHRTRVAWALCGRVVWCVFSCVWLVHFAQVGFSGCRLFSCQGIGVVRCATQWAQRLGSKRKALWLFDATHCWEEKKVMDSSPWGARSGTVPRFSWASNLHIGGHHLVLWRLLCLPNLTTSIFQTLRHMQENVLLFYPISRWMIKKHPCFPSISVERQEQLTG